MSAHTPGLSPQMFRLLALLPILTSTALAFSPEELRLSVEARGVLAHQCTKCHGQHKQKGELRLDTREAAMKGGESGASIAPGKPDESDLLRRVVLPTADDEHMPPEKKVIESQNIETLRKWIAAGAP